MDTLPPPQTRCDAAEPARAVCAVRQRILQKVAALEEACAGHARAHAHAAALRRDCVRILECEASVFGAAAQGSCWRWSLR